jgi:hypothetical protein
MLVYCMNLKKFGKVFTSNWGTRWRSWLRHYTTSRKVAGSIPDDIIGIFLLTLSFRQHYGPGVNSAFNKNEYQESLGVKPAGA